MLTLEAFGKIIRGALNNVTESGGGSLKEATKDFIQKKIEDEALIIPYAEAIVAELKRRRFSLTHEKLTQQQIEDALLLHVSLDFTRRMVREYRIAKDIIPDFFQDGIAMEVKIKGSARSIYAQCKRYCAHERVRALILVTSRNMGFPAMINGKPCYYINLSEAWL